MRMFLLIAAVSGFFAVAAGAFGAHGLKGRFSAEMLAVFETGARYQMYHTLALLAVAWLCERAAGVGAVGGTSPISVTLVTAAGWLFVAGIVIFSGSLYLLALTGARWLGAITPLGGLAFLAGWAALAVAAWRK